MRARKIDKRNNESVLIIFYFNALYTKLRNRELPAVVTEKLKVTQPSHICNAGIFNVRLNKINILLSLEKKPHLLSLVYLRGSRSNWNLEM